MKLTTCVLFLAIIFGVQSIKANSIKIDSAEVIHADTGKSKPVYNKGLQKAAVRDARNFKLQPEQATAFKHGKISPMSDYFKPTSDYTADANMLSDSTYVKEFRQAAYYHSGHHSAGKALLIAGAVAVGFVVLFVLAYATFGAK